MIRRTLAQRAEIRQLLNAALAEVDEKHRVVFVLRDIEGFSTQETAEALGLSVANVKVRLLRARLQLRERLTRVLGDEATRVSCQLTTTITDMKKRKKNS